MENSPENPEPGHEVIVLGAGCFWCVEAVFQKIEGVISVTSGYTAGDTPAPTYQQICTGRTGHAEVVKVNFDPEVVSLAEVLDWFWRAHDPTTLNQQGADKGTQYRSAIFYSDDAQRKIAEESRDAAQAQFDAPIVTEITEASEFFVAEGYHQDYYRENGSAPYCFAVIHPKLLKLKLL